MAKITKIDLRIAEHKNYDVHYNVKQGFHVKTDDLPMEFVELMGAFQGYKSLDELYSALTNAVAEYQQLCEKTTLVICYGAFASHDILMNHDPEHRGYHGRLAGCSQKIKHDSMRQTSIGIDYGVYKKYERPNGKNQYQEYDVVNGNLASYSGRIGSGFESEIPYTPEAYAFFESMRAAMAKMVLQLSKLIDATPDQFAAIVASKPKMISMGGEDNG